MKDNDIKKSINFVFRYKNEEQILEIIKIFIEQYYYLFFLRDKLDIEEVFREIENIFRIRDDIKTVDPSVFSKYLTNEGEIRKKRLDDNEKIEAEDVYKYYQHIINKKNCEYTKAFYTIVYNISNGYEKIKRENGYLDYNDLIFKTKNLLNKYNTENVYSNWVQYKLDNGIEHILVDEAQDTSPIQWNIINSLASEFFVGTDNDKNRTIFVVGDRKQSIFSFQGAIPDNFNKMEYKYEKSIADVEKKFKSIKLNTSFRSSKSILDIINSVCENLSDNIFRNIKHNQMFNITGRVEIFPLVGESSKENTPFNWINFQQDNAISSKQKIAIAVVKEIKKWFDNKKVIVDKRNKQERLLKYSDIIILIKKRDELISYLIKALNEYNIPTFGNDKFKIGEHIIAKDIISLLKFILFPTDDLNFANLVKSPFLNMSEDDLFELCKNKNIWNKYLKKEFTKKEMIFLEDVIEKSKTLNIYQILYYIFDIKNIRTEFKKRFPYVADEIINEFLSLANKYEKNHNNSTILNFIDYIENSNLLIKRDMEQSLNVIRIMTIHASKGMESPIVILPNINNNPSTDTKDDGVLKYEIDEGFDIPLLKLENTKITDNIKNKMKEAKNKEQERLLYVAMTRAENELYICGIEPNSKKDSDKTQKENKDVRKTWYNRIKEVAEESTESKNYYNEFFNGESIFIGDEHIYNKELNQNNIDNNIIRDEFNDFLIKEELTSTSNKIKDKNKIINPSTYFSTSNIIKPMDNTALIQRGKLVHKLLQILPTKNKDDWSNILSTQNNDVRDIVLNILTKFSIFFNSNSLAEVPIYGKVDDFIVSGQIDRLVINNDKIIIIDYKNTNSIPTKISNNYIEQLNFYKKIIKKIYTDKAIESYIIWTNFGEITRVN
jgi:ATP-dependent helicase/nuclease subunit A